jgi:hypothetical protein
MAKIVWNGHTFHRGEEVEVTNETMIAKARKNPFYSVDGETYVPPGGQPHPNAVQSAGPVAQPKTELAEMNVAELRALAAERGVDVEGLSKAEIREKLSESEED